MESGGLWERSPVAKPSVSSDAVKVSAAALLNTGNAGNSKQRKPDRGLKRTRSGFFSLVHVCRAGNCSVAVLRLHAELANFAGVSLFRDVGFEAFHSVFRKDGVNSHFDVGQFAALIQPHERDCSAVGG